MVYMYTVRFLFILIYFFKISVAADVERIFKMTMVMIVEEFSYVVEVHRTIWNSCW